jgi:hypothetical protein
VIRRTFFDGARLGEQLRFCNRLFSIALRLYYEALIGDQPNNDLIPKLALRPLDHRSLSSELALIKSED